MTSLKIIISAVIFQTALNSVAQTALSEEQRDQLRKKADEARERNARERDAIQRNFASPEPSKGNTAGTPTTKMICRAAIAAMMGRAPNIVNVDQESHGVLLLSYTRPSDKKLWTYRCKVSGASVEWASEPGRWRNHPLDEKVSYQIEGSTITISQRFSDGSKVNKSFSTSEF